MQSAPACIALPGDRPVLTFFAAPKPFLGEFAVIQRNALRSWATLPGCEIIVFGDEEGLAHAADEVGARHLAEVARTSQGTPLVSDMFEQARIEATRPFLCFVNADVILTSTLLDAVHRVEARRFLLAGQRWDLQVREELRFDDGWEEALRLRARREGRLHPPAGSDFFAFPRDVNWQMPPFAIGRPGWDNWTLRRARQLSLVVIDATHVVLAVHQDHPYAPAQTLEAAANLELLGGPAATLDHATRVLTKRWLLPALEPRRLSRRAIGSPLAGRLRRVLRLA
jgi:hypothetical protein